MKGNKYLKPKAVFQKLVWKALVKLEALAIDVNYVAEGQYESYQDVIL